MAGSTIMLMGLRSVRFQVNINKPIARESPVAASILSLASLEHNKYIKLSYISHAYSANMFYFSESVDINRIQINMLMIQQLKMENKRVRDR